MKETLCPGRVSSPGAFCGVLLAAMASYTCPKGGEEMRRNAARYIVGYGVTVLTGVLLQFLYEEMGGVVTQVLSPMNASPWEMGKLCFWPYLVGALIIWRLGEGTDSRGGHCALLVGMPLAATALAYFLPGAAPMLRYAVPAGGIGLYAWVLRRRLWGGELFWYTLAILLGIAYLLLTAAAPEGALFTDPLALPTAAIPV